MATYDVDKYRKQYDMVIEIKIKPNKTFSTGDTADSVSYTHLTLPTNREV